MIRPSTFDVVRVRLSPRHAQAFNKPHINLMADWRRISLLFCMCLCFMDLDNFFNFTGAVSVTIVMRCDAKYFYFIPYVLLLPWMWIGSTDPAIGSCPSGSVHFYARLATGDGDWNILIVNTVCTLQQNSLWWQLSLIVVVSLKGNNAIKILSITNIIIELWHLLYVTETSKAPNMN